MVDSIESLESLVRVIGLPYARKGDTLLLEYEHKELGRVGLVIQYDGPTGSIRVSIPTDIEPTSEGLDWLLRSNFSSLGYKYAIDYEGFIAVLQDYPRECIRDARSLKEALLNIVEGYRRLLEHVE